LKLHLNTDKVKDFTKKLKSVHKSALPVAVRQTLNDAAFNVKQDTMPKSADQAFKKREPNFFKANSKVNMAEGFDINKMQSAIGFFENKLRNKATNYAVQELEQQENKGKIEHKTFIPTDQARVGGTSAGLVKNNARISKIRDVEIIRASQNGKTRSGRPMNVATAKQRFVRAAIMAKKLYGSEAYVLGNKSSKGSRTLSIINNITFNRNSRTLKINRTPLYSVVKGRSVEVKATGFMKRASFETAMTMDEMYIKRAQERLKKHGILK